MAPANDRQIQEAWHKIKISIQKTTQNKLRTDPLVRKKTWMSDEIPNLMEERRVPKIEI